MELLPLSIVYCEILPLCDIDIRLAFKVPPKKLKLVSPLILSNDQETFVRIVSSHMQMIRFLHQWHEVLLDCMHRFAVDNAQFDYWFCLLVLLPQLKILHGSKWRDLAQQLVSDDTVLEAIRIGYDPDISIYMSRVHYTRSQL